MPAHIKDNLMIWVAAVELDGLEEDDGCARGSD
jgi:hypothetical protein